MVILQASVCLAALISAAYAGGEVGRPRRYFAHHNSASDERDVWFGGELSRYPWRVSDSASHEHRRHPRFDCGGPAFRAYNFGHRRSFCCGGLFYDDVVESLNCCGLNIYDHRLYSCNGGKTVVPLFRPSYEVDWRSFTSGRYGSGNARIAFDQNDAPHKCGTISIPAFTQYDLCCDGHYFPNPHLYYGCCASRCFDSRWYRCSPEKKIILIEGPHHGHHFGHYHHPHLVSHWGGPYFPVVPSPVHIGKELHSADIVPAVKAKKDGHSREIHHDLIVPGFKTYAHVPAVSHHVNPYVNFHHQPHVSFPQAQRLHVQPVGGKAHSENQAAKAKIPNFSHPFAQSLVQQFVPQVLAQVQADGKRQH